MYLVEEHYYTINKPFLKALGIWPNEKPCTVLLKRFLILLITVPYIFMQISVFFTTECTMTLFLKVATMSFPLNGLLAKYCVFIFKSKTIINFHHQIREDWKSMRDKIESNIILQNVHLYHTYIRFLFSLSSIIIIFTAVLQLLPVILDILFPLDEPRPRKLLLIKYFFAQNEYFYCKVVYEFAITTICLIIAFATGTQLLGFIFHSYGLFKIARYRIEHSIENCVLHVPHPKKEHAICIAIMHAAFAHRRAMEFSYSLVSSFNVFLCFLTVTYLLTLIITVYGIFDAVVISRDVNNLIWCVFGAGLILIYMFISHYIGQKFTDYNRELSIYMSVVYLMKRYSTSWYSMPLSSQKLILFIIRRTNKDFILSLGNMFAGKLENFALVIRIVISYVTVLYNHNQKE